MDHHGGFENNAGEILAAESRLVEDADLVIVTSGWLEREVAPRARAIATVRNGCEHCFFRDPPAAVFRDEAGRRVIGYFGAIAEWFDLALVREVAKAHPDALVLLVGNDTVGAGAALADLPNVRLTGEVRYEELPYWVHGFDVCLLPFRVIPLTEATNPVKVYEYLAAGKPVVAVDLPEMAQFDGLVHVAAHAGGFVQAVSRALAAPGDPAPRQAFAAGQTWQHRAEALDAALAALPEPRVSVVVLAYNNLAFTEACLDSIELYSDYANLEVIVVDNASSDGSREWLQAWQQRPSAAGHQRRLILNERNLGFSAGNNVGLRAATGEVLVMLNNDTYVTPGWVRGLCNHLRQDPGLGLLGPVTNNIGNEAKIDIQYADMAAMIAEAGKYTRRHAGHRLPLRTAAFFCVAMRREVYERIGDMDEAFGVGFFEDDDYCRRVEQAGLSVACAEDVFVHHHLSASFDALKAEAKQALFQANKAIYEKKWGAWEPHAYR
jgi:GT2 family glycosyltransferase